LTTEPVSSLQLRWPGAYTRSASVEIQSLIATPRKHRIDRADEISPASNTPPITKAGDVWRLGQNLLLCGDPLAVGMVADAVNGDARAREHLLRLIGQMDAFEAGLEQTAPAATEDAEIMARFKARLIEEIKAQGSTSADVTIRREHMERIAIVSWYRQLVSVLDHKG